MRSSRLRRSSRAFAAVIVVGHMLAPGLVNAQEAQAPTPPGNDAAVDAALAREQCARRSVLEHGGRLYAACGTGGVLIFERTPDGVSLRERRVGLGDAQAVFVHDDRVWVELQRLEALPLAQLPSATPAGSAPVAGTAPTSPPPPSVPPAAPAAKPRESRVAPPRVGGVLRLEGSLRPFLPLGDLGIGALAGLALTYHGTRHWYVRAEVMPIGGVAVQGNDGWVLGMFAIGGYDHPLFALGVGIGTVRMHDTYYHWEMGDGTSSYRTDEGMRFAIDQSIRLGALDGLQAHCDTTFLLADERWRFGYVNLGIQVPAGARNWLVADGGGSDLTNFFFFEAGLKRLISGERDSGSLFIAVTAGVGAIRPDALDDSEDMDFGPMLGFRLEWRK